jgi:hypothetical protein
MKRALTLALVIFFPGGILAWLCKKAYESYRESESTLTDSTMRAIRLSAAKAEQLEAMEGIPRGRKVAPRLDGLTSVYTRAAGR